MSSSAPRDFATAILSAPPAAAMTRAPSALPISTAVRPTPPRGAQHQERFPRLQMAAVG